MTESSTTPAPAAAARPKGLVRILNGGLPVLTDWATVRDELNEAMSGPRRRTLVREMSAGSGRYDVHYRDGRRVVVRPATDQDRAQVARAVVLVAHAAEHGTELDPCAFGPGVTLDGMDGDEWLDAMYCADDPLPTCPRR